MSVFRRVVRGLPVFAVFAAVLLVTAGSAQAATTTATSTPLPPGFGAITVDDPTGRVFVSSPTSNTISVRAADGTAVASLTEPGPGRMLTRDGKLYVASTTAGRIDVFDTTTLQQLAPLAQGLVSPGPIAWVNGRFWTTTGTCSSWNVQLVSIDPLLGMTVFQRNALSYCPDFVASPTESVLLGFDLGLSPTTFYRIDVTTGTPVIATSYFSNSSNTAQVAFLPSGDRFVAASGAPYQLVEFRAADLQPTGVVYPTGPYPNSVAVDGANGRIAGGINAAYDNDVQLFPIDNPIRQWAYDFGSSSNLLYSHGLAWSPNGEFLYAIDGYPYSSPSTVNLTVIHFAKTATTTALQASSTVTTWGDAIDFTASVAAVDGGAPDGTVTFLANGAPLASGPVVNGVATAHLTTVPAGTHSIVARYSGNDTYATSDSDPITVTVRSATTAMSLTGSPLHTSGAVRTQYGQPATFTATITVNETGSPAPSGTVVFSDGNQVLATVAVVDGQATLTKDDLSVGNHTITATFSSPSAAGSSASIRAQVQRADSQTQLSASSSQSTVTQNVTFTAVVASALTSDVVPTGSVTFYDGDPLLGSSAIGTVALTNGRADLTTSFLTPGTHTIFAVYSGDDGYRTSRTSLDHTVTLV